MKNARLITEKIPLNEKIPTNAGTVLAHQWIASEVRRMSGKGSKVRAVYTKNECYIMRAGSELAL